jgi:K+-transporting ATPase ATPase B chain
VTISVPVLAALLVCLMPTTIGGLLPAIGIAGMDRLLGHNVIALSGRAIEAAGDVNIVLMDKTGTITLGNRCATEFLPAEGVQEAELARAAMLSSLADDTPEGRSIVVLAKEKLRMRGRDMKAPTGAKFLNFSAETRMSGIDIDTICIRKGAVDAIKEFVKNYGATFPEGIEHTVEKVAKEGGTPLVVATDGNVLGVIRLKDILKRGIKERLNQIHQMGIQSVMITGDNPHTAAAIAAEAGVSKFIAQAKPETKLSKIRAFQSEGYMVAMIGDGTNDAPALAQADVAVAMNAGTQAAREAANMIDLDSSPIKILDIVEIGKQILITRGSLTTFSVANDVAK